MQGGSDVTGDKKYYLVYQFEGVWRLTPKAYKRMLSLGSKGREFDLDKMSGSRRLGEIDARQVIDWTEEEFAEREARA